jgi:carbonic anhydrase
MDRLIKGYRKFRQTYFAGNQETFVQLAHGQAPNAMVISCSDSRVDPGLVFDTGPGELFTLRNIANLVPPYSTIGIDRCSSTSAAIACAVNHLSVEHIVVLGHSNCGGVKVLLGRQDRDYMWPWMQNAELARKRALAAVGDGSAQVLQRACEHEVVKLSLSNLAGYPCVEERLRAGLIELHGAWFDIERAELHVLDQASGQFEKTGSHEFGLPRHIDLAGNWA